MVALVGISWDTPYKIFELINTIALVGSVLFLTYAIASAIVYLVIQRNTTGTNIGDKAKAFTGLDESTGNRATTIVTMRLIFSMVITAVIVTNTHVFLMGAIYTFIIELNTLFS